jgi:protein-tyrosine phosphatase
VARVLEGKVELLLDGGPAELARSSTVVLCDRRRVSVAREGAVPAQAILDAVAERILVVCTGNICRSPVAEAMLRGMVSERLGCPPDGLPRYGLGFASFGTMGLAGREPSDYAVAVAEEHGYDIRAHRARSFSIELAKSARLLYGLDRSHIDFLSPYFHTRRDDLRLLDPGGKEILDPYGKPLAFYRRVVEAMAKACQARADEIVAEINSEGAPGVGDKA